MTDLFVDCPSGLAGDMLLAAFIDLGVPESVIEKPLLELGLQGAFKIDVKEQRSCGFRGLNVSVLGLEEEPKSRKWSDIRQLILQPSWSESLARNVHTVFQNLAEAEASVHGEDINDVHFHEVGSIDALVDIVGVCAAIEHLGPKQIFCGIPPAGRGSVSTSHGILPIPAPAVIELARRNKIPLANSEGLPEAELTTPTGLALMSVLANSFCQPSHFAIKKIGVGLGERELDRPNFLRICELDSCNDSKDSYSPTDIFRWQKVVIQEAWIDDLSPEDLSSFVDVLRKTGAIDVAYKHLNMKKGRQGVSITALVMPEDAPKLRLTWLTKSSTIGLRERIENRCILLRQSGFVKISCGKIKVKRVRRPGGGITCKPEHDDLLRLSLSTGKTLDELRLEALKASEQFQPEEEWQW